MKKLISNLFTTLIEATCWTEEQKKVKGCICPCCEQVVKIYKYKFYSTSAIALIKLYKLTLNSEKNKFHVYQFAEADGKSARAAHFADLRWWGLVQNQVIDIEGKKHSGYWSITELGEKFVKGEISVREKIMVFNNTFYGFDGDSVTIKDVIKNHFDYFELMSS
jgi:hypothetical protein